MKSKILIATALASLLVGTGIASAQVTNENGRNAPGARGATPSTQHAQTPSERTQPGNRMGQSEGPSGTRMGQPEPKKSGTTNPSAQNERNRMERNPPAAENERGRQGSGASENRERTEQNRSTAERPASAALSADQRTKIRSMVLGQGNAPRIARSDVNVNLSVGTRIPRDHPRIRLLPLPQTVVEVEPRWRGYDYFLVGDEIVVVEPGTFEIVAIIPA
jgi:hypothetical protein